VVSLSTSCKTTVSCSPFGLVISQRSGNSRISFGAFIQLSGLYAPPSAWMATQPSAFTMMSRTASGNDASRRPT